MEVQQYSDIFHEKPPWDSTNSFDEAEQPFAAYADSVATPEKATMFQEDGLVSTPDKFIEMGDDSPFSTGMVAASTPFHAQTFSKSNDGKNIVQSSNPHSCVRIETFSTSSILNEFEEAEVGHHTEEVFKPSGGNETYDLQMSSKHVNTTYDKISNETFTSKAAFSEKKNMENGGERNATFDAQTEAKDLCTSTTETFKQPEQVDCVKKTLRKPLSALPQPKASNIGRPGSNRGARSIVPRMNTAALSRIQARSPEHKISKEQKPEATKLPPTKTLKKPRSFTAARKSLLPSGNNNSKKSSLPPSNSKLATIKGEKLESKLRQTGVNSAHGNKLKTPSPKGVAHYSKYQGNLNSDNLQRKCVSKSASLAQPCRPTTKTSKLQRPSGLRAVSARLSVSRQPPGSSVKSVAAPTSNNEVIFNATEKRCEVNGTENKYGSAETKNCRDTKDVSQDLTTSNCCIALAILLDYTVNQLHGMSAPMLSNQNQRLVKLLSEKTEFSKSLSTKIEEMDSHLVSVIESHQEEMKLEKCRFEESITELKAEMAKQQERFEEDMEQIRLAHECNVTQLQEEWASEQERIEVDWQANLESKVQEEVEERIKPFVNARAEVESLSAVLEIKNEKVHKLEMQALEYKMQQNEVTSLQYQVDKMKQKNEDLSMQIQEKKKQNRISTSEKEELRQILNDREKQLMKLDQQNKELLYRLDTISPSASPSFNPVFTTSPTLSNSPPEIKSSNPSGPVNQTPTGRPSSIRNGTFSTPRNGSLCFKGAEEDVFNNSL